MKNERWNWWFYAPFLGMTAAGAATLVVVEKGEDVIFVNGMHSPFLDYFFYYGTELGNGLLYVVIALLLAIKNVRHGLIALTCLSLTGLAVQLLKNLVFSEWMRPMAVLAGEPLHLVEGVKILKHFSFPSGHAATAFSMFCLLSLWIKPRWVGLFLFALALIAAISRIYLVQHFLVDVYFGALLGVAVTSLTWRWFSQKPVLLHLDKKPLSFILTGA